MSADQELLFKCELASRLLGEAADLALSRVDGSAGADRWEQVYQAALDAVDAANEALDETRANMHESE